MTVEAPARTPQGPLADLVEFLRDKKLLLLVDNCEHVVDECAEVLGTLLRAAPELHILATSRQPLGILGEHVWPVAPLHTPTEPMPVRTTRRWLSSLNARRRCCPVSRSLRRTGMRSPKYAARSTASRSGSNSRRRSCRPGPSISC
jgi:hypothetical protein